MDTEASHAPAEMRFGSGDEVSGLTRPVAATPIYESVSQ